MVWQNLDEMKRVLYISSSFGLFGVESRDFSHAEKERTAKNCPRLSFCEFAQLCKQFNLSQHEKNHVTQLSTAKN